MSMNAMIATAAANQRRNGETLEGPRVEDFPLESLSGGALLLRKREDSPV